MALPATMPVVSAMQFSYLLARVGNWDSQTLDGAEHQLLDELLLKIQDDHLLGTKGQSLLLDGIPLLLLANIGKEALSAVSNQK